MSAIPVYYLEKFYRECQYIVDSQEADSPKCNRCRTTLDKDTPRDQGIRHLHCNATYCRTCFLDPRDPAPHCPFCKQRLEFLARGCWQRKEKLALFPGHHNGKSILAIDVPTAHRHLGGYDDRISLVRLWDEYEEKYWNRTQCFDKINVQWRIPTSLLVDIGHDRWRFNLNSDDMYSIWKYSRVFGVRDWLRIRFEADDRLAFLMPRVPQVIVRESKQDALKEAAFENAMKKPARSLHIPVPTTMARELLRWSWSSDINTVNAFEKYETNIEPHVREFNELAAAKKVHFWYVTSVADGGIRIFPCPDSVWTRANVRRSQYQKYLVPGWNSEKKLGAWTEKPQLEEEFLQRFLEEVEQVANVEDDETEAAACVRWWGDEAEEDGIYDRAWKRCRAVKSRRAMLTGMHGLGIRHTVSKQGVGGHDPEESEDDEHDELQSYEDEADDGDEEKDGDVDTDMDVDDDDFDE
jgi:hypothetical protein